jgi:hypothetical protein
LGELGSAHLAYENVHLKNTTRMAFVSFVRFVVQPKTENVTHNTQFSPVSAQKSPSPSFFRTKMSDITNICFIFGLRNKTTGAQQRSISYI